MSTETLSQVLKLSRETNAGTLVGYYTDAFDCAVVTETSIPTAIPGPEGFTRQGNGGLQQWLDRFRREDLDTVRTGLLCSLQA